MMARELSRPQLEALVIARALVSCEPTDWLRVIDRQCVSPALVTILERMADPSRADEPRTKGQEELAERARAVTVFEMLLLSRVDLLAHVNALPDRPVRRRVSALDIGTESAA